MTLIGDYVIKFLAFPPGMHETQPRAGTAGTSRYAGILLQSVDIVDDMRADGDCEPRGFRPVGIDRR